MARLDELLAPGAARVIARLDTCNEISGCKLSPGPVYQALETGWPTCTVRDQL